METKGELNQESYWIYETFRTYKHAPHFGQEPRKLMVFKSKDDARAFGTVFILLSLLTLRCVLLEELKSIIETEFAGNYIILEADDVFIVAARYEFTPLADYDEISEG